MLIWHGPGIPAQSVQSKSSTKTSQPSIEAKWIRVDVVQIPGRHKKRTEQTPSYVDYANAYFEGSLKDHKFKLECVVPKQEGQAAYILLTVDGKQQIVCTTSQTWGLVWAGDRDGDGKLDLVLRSVGDGGADSSSLYLSTLAKPGELLAYSESFDVEEGC
jgi:hypothetical protein